MNYMRLLKSLLTRAYINKVIVGPAKNMGTLGAFLKGYGDNESERFNRAFSLFLVKTLLTMLGLSGFLYIVYKLSGL